jgi:Xaa-Pro aminopeptidase
MRNVFTYVLKAHIALAVAKFPENTLGYRLVRHKFFDEIWIVS